jgi:uroporphyrinogen-III synthase
MTVSKYKLVAAPRDEIEEKVNQLIEAGWQPLGAPFILPAKPDDLTLQENMVYQAMILST